MPFEKIEKNAGSGMFGARASGVRVSCFAVGSSQQAHIALGADVQAPTGLIKGARFDALLGTGEESGFLGLQKTESLSARKVGSFGAGHRSLIRIAIGSLGIPAAFKPTDLPYRIEGDMLVIDIRPLLPAAKLARAA